MLILTLPAFWFAYVYGFLIRNGLKYGGVEHTLKTPDSHKKIILHKYIYVLIYKYE
jgi:hypothetical protein